MLNMLIADDNIYYAKTLMDYINANNDNVRVCNISIDGKETLDLLNNNDKIDIFLLDLKMPVYNGIEILNYLDESKKIKYQKSCIVISGEIDMVNQIVENTIVYNYIYKSHSITQIMTLISQLIQAKSEVQKNEHINSRIDEELEILHFNPLFLGTRYLKECIYYIIKNSKKDFDNLKRDVYPLIAYKHKKTVNNIKCNINSSVNAMYFDCEIEKIIKYFNFSKDYKPTTKLIINTIVNKILKELE